jgi:hypothetical protein
MLLAASPAAARNFVVGSPTASAVVVSRPVFAGSARAAVVRPVGVQRGLWRVAPAQIHHHHHHGHHFRTHFRTAPAFSTTVVTARGGIASPARTAVIAGSANPVTVIFPAGERVVVSSATINATGTPVIAASPGSATVLARSGDGLLQTADGTALVSRGMIFRSSPGNVVITNPAATLVEDGSGGVAIVSQASID